MLMFNSIKNEKRDLNVRDFVVFIFIYLCSTSTFAEIEGNHGKKNVLILHSYPADLSWSESLQGKINELNRINGSPFKFEVIYLDYFKRHDQNYLSHVVKRVFNNTLNNGEKWHAILAQDDLAAKVIIENQELVRDNNINVFLLGVTEGIYDGHQVRFPHEVSIDSYDASKVIKVLSHTQHDIESIHLVVDDTKFGEHIYTSVYPKLISYFDVPVYVTRDTPLEELKKSIASKSKNDIVLLGSYRLRNVSETVQHYGDEVIDVLNPTQLVAPVYVLIDSHIRNGVIGGAVRTSALQAEHSFNLLAQTILAGEPASNQWKKATYAQYKFDYEALKQKNIPLNVLPLNYKLINEPTFHGVDKRSLYFLVAIIVFLIIFIIIVGMHSHHKNLVQNELGRKNEEILKSQEDIISMLGEVIESRSGETGNHVKRVSLISEQLAELYGLSAHEVTKIKIVSPLHDVGKVNIPDSILNKPGKLTDEEFEVIKSHTTTGYKVLEGSDSELIRLAATVAHEHHEKWNGKGYPLGKKRQEIHIFSRIVAIADVLDALLSERPYKKPWPADKVYALFKEERGHHFDPELTDLLLDNYDSFIKIYAK